MDDDFVEEPSWGEMLCIVPFLLVVMLLEWLGRIAGQKDYMQ